MTKFWILILCLMSWMQMAFASPHSWRVKTSYEAFQNKYSSPNEKRSVLTIKNEVGSVQIYKPENPPFGVVKTKVIQEGERVLVLTLWPDGASQMVIRVFDPQISANPICEIKSLSSGLVARVLKRKVEVKKASLSHKNRSLKSEWSECYTYK